MPGDADATRRRLLDAARAEFAQYGIAGARVDRIADAARANKAQIYHYFGSKDELFNAVFREIVEHTLSATPIDTDDLPEYAGRLFDGYEQAPDIQRIATWHRLERAHSEDPVDVVLASMRDKVDAVAAAQKAGTVPTNFSAVDLLALVLHLSGLWAQVQPEFSPLAAKHSRMHRRQVVVDAVRALLRP
jgi:AcrR family transcriptional regulator